MTKNQMTYRGNYSGKGSDVIAQIIAEHNIDMNLFYVDSFKVKKGSWDTAAKKRDQSLEWQNEIQTSTTKDSKGKVTGTKVTDNVQIMTGHGKHFPEFMVHENKNNSIEVTFRRKPIEFDLMKTYNDIIKRMPAFPYTRRKPAFSSGSGNAFELSTFDAHFGKLAAEVETGYRNYDLKIAHEDYKYVHDDLINYAIPFKPELCILPLGQDIYHMDNMDSHTTHGQHTLDVDGRITKVNDIVFYTVVATILKLRKLAPVKVIWSPGNHDHFASYMLCFSIAQYFRKDPLVHVDMELPKAGKEIHKCVLWGKTLIGFTHRIVGRHSNWANELAQSFPEEWAKSKFREWHHGDQHKKKVVKVHPVDTMGGVLLRQLTALSPVDKWHTENLYTDAVPGGEAFILNKEKGVIANFMAWTGQYEEYRNDLIQKTK
jgi:hypothetical protein